LQVEESLRREAERQRQRVTIVNPQAAAIVAAEVARAEQTAAEAAKALAKVQNRLSVSQSSERPPGGGSVPPVVETAPLPSLRSVPPTQKLETSPMMVTVIAPLEPEPVAAEPVAVAAAETAASEPPTR